jgi:hypothetical protein
LSTLNPEFFDKSCGRGSGQDSGNLPRGQNGPEYYQQVTGPTAQPAQLIPAPAQIPSDGIQKDGIQKDGIHGRDSKSAYARIVKRYQNLLKKLAEAERKEKE